MSRYAAAWAGTAAAFLALDLIWLGGVAGTFYRERLGHLLTADVNVAAAVVFYLLYVTGIAVFAVRPALAAASWRQAVSLGGLFGLVAYGTYDLTNLATLRDWPIEVTVIDMFWGAVVTSLSATAGYFAGRRLRTASS